MAGKDPIDPNVGPRFVLAGDVVTMDDHLTVVPDGRIYVDSGVITAVQPAAAPPPAGFEKVKPLQSKGTIYPGLIELHNHLSYDVLPLWQVPKRYSNRDQWQGPATQGLISGPMKVIGSHPGYPEAVVRYVECKCLLGGVTTSQGVALFSFSGISTYYRGIVRNVERTDDPELPAWKSHIADVAAKDASIFVDSIKHSRYLLHLSEGTDASARAHFEALHLSGNTWAINQNLAGIHCVALTDADFAALASRGGSMVWSPLSNLLLYGATADVAAARKEGVRISLGSDWSPSGSKNLFAELKVARLAAQASGALSDSDLIRCATTNAAQTLGWDKALGSLEVGKRADLLVVSGNGSDPYARLLDADESDIQLVTINGAARYGNSTLMNALAPAPHSKLETVVVGDKKRRLDLRQQTEFPAVAALTLAAATARLREGLADIATLANDLLHKPLAQLMGLNGDAPPMLLLDHDEPPGLAIRPHLDHPDAGLAPPIALPFAQVKAPLKPIKLDPVCVSSDPAYGANLTGQKNLPKDVRAGLQAVYPA